ncbi:MAG: hypothetical protein SCARUB_02923 [Candidatus Scalindua rubra]|uniref:Uncharacterized protein n=1 Tax=Candidatus Scalindua rubra TaxID=1872076 RepID=A0A1E3X8J9_9BACT|nr:MAG: hypothetical protein SCARUB_02923 [Candidatus Scalindua rubra]
MGRNKNEVFTNNNDRNTGNFYNHCFLFNNAINKLILCSKEHNTNNTNLEFSRLINSCDMCHIRFYEKVGRQLEFTDLVRISLNKNDGTND